MTKCSLCLFACMAFVSLPFMVVWGPNLPFVFLFACWSNDQNWPSISPSDGLFLVAAGACARSGSTWYVLAGPRNADVWMDLLMLRALDGCVACHLVQYKIVRVQTLPLMNSIWITHLSISFFHVVVIIYFVFFLNERTGLCSFQHMFGCRRFCFLLGRTLTYPNGGARPTV